MELVAEVDIDAPAREAWMVLGERFAHIGEWATPITTSSLQGEPCVGAVRICQIARFGPVAPGTIHERLTAFDPATMSFEYESIQGMPAFIQRAVNRWSVHARGDGLSTVRSHATLELRGPIRLLGFLLAWRMRAGGRRVLDELKHQIEHGRPHPRKLARLLH